MLGDPGEEGGDFATGASFERTLAGRAVEEDKRHDRENPGCDDAESHDRRWPRLAVRTG